MHEHFLERIGQLEQSVRRWRLACFALAVIIVSLLAVGGTVGTMVMLELPELQALRAEVQAQRAHAEMLQAEAHAQRDQAMQAQRRAEDALRAQQALRQKREQ